MNEKESSHIPEKEGVLKFNSIKRDYQDFELKLTLR